MCGVGYSVQCYKKPSMAQGNSAYLLHPERLQFSLQPGPQPMFQLFPFLTCCLQLNQGLLHLFHLLNIDLLLFELKQRKKMQHQLHNENRWVNFWLCTHCQGQKHQPGRTCPDDCSQCASDSCSGLHTQDVTDLSHLCFPARCICSFRPQCPDGNDGETEVIICCKWLRAVMG